MKTRGKTKTSDSEIMEVNKPKTKLTRTEICGFVFATQIAQFLFFLNPKPCSVAAWTSVRQTW